MWPLFGRRERWTALRTRRVDQVQRAAVSVWENEGGSLDEAPATPRSDVRLQPSALIETAASKSALDDRQDALMAATSSDGRPPSHSTRMLEWRWLLIGAGLLMVFGIAWIALSGVSGEAVVAALAYGLLLMMGSSPVWAAAVLRGQEERSARRTATKELQIVPDFPPLAIIDHDKPERVARL